jgi:hypothetical protein
MDLKQFCEKYEIEPATVDAVVNSLAEEFTEVGRGDLIEAFETEPCWRGSSWSGPDPSVGIFSGSYEEVEVAEPWAQSVFDGLAKLNPPAHSSILDRIHEYLITERMENR